MTNERFGYSSLVTESLGLAWKQKSLWPLGFLLGGTGSYQFSEVFNGEDFGDDELGFALLLILILLGLLFGLIFFVLSSIAEGGLVAACERLATGHITTLGESWRAGTRYWLRMIALVLVFMLISVPLSLALIGVPIVLGVNIHPVVGILTGLITMAVWTTVLVFMVPWFSYARRHVVLADAGIGESLSHATRIIRHDPLRTFAISALRVVFIIATTIPLMVLGAIVLAPVIALYLSSGIIGVLFGIVFAFPILAVVGSFINTAGSYFWTLAYMWVARGPVDAPEPPSTSLTPDSGR
jgi:hypothetical protein